MNTLNDFLQTLRKYRFHIFGFLLFNLLVTTIILKFSIVSNQHKASVSIVFNEVKLSFSNNQALDYMFGKNIHIFTNILHSDSLLNHTVTNHHLADHYGISSYVENRDKQARNQLRRSISFEMDEKKIQIWLRDHDPEKAELILNSIVSNVKHFYFAVINENNKVTEKIANHSLKELDKRINNLNGNLLQTVTSEKDTALIRSYKEPLQHSISNTLSRKLELTNVIQQLESSEKLPKYEPYFVIHEGVFKESPNMIMLIFLTIVGNIIAFMVEMQTIVMAAYFLNKLKENN